jgi:hypothetical protein
VHPFTKISRVGNVKIITIADYILGLPNSQVANIENVALPRATQREGGAGPPLFSLLLVILLAN